MAITKNISSRPDGDLSPTSSSGEDEDEEVPHTEISSSSSGSDDGASEADSGMGSDACDLSELGDASTEFCQVGKQTCCLPLELNYLPDLCEILSLNSWNELLSEEDRFQLSEFLPDMDHESFVRTITELFSRANFHFGSPVDNLFALIKGGLCEPRVVLGRRAANLLQKRRHYHYLRRYQNEMVAKLFRIRNTWRNCKSYSIEEKLQKLKHMKKRTKFSVEINSGLDSETELESEYSDEGIWKKRFKIGQSLRLSRPSLPKGILKVAAPKRSFKKENDLGLSRDQVPVYGEEDENDGYEHGYKILSRSSLLILGKKQEFKEKNANEAMKGRYSNMPQSISTKNSSDLGVTIASYAPPSKNFKNPEHEWPLHSAPVQLSDGQKSKFDDRNIRAKKLKAMGEFSTRKTKRASDSVVKPYKLHLDPQYGADYRGKTSGNMARSKHDMNCGSGTEYFRTDLFDQNEQTESDSSDEGEEVEDIKHSMRMLKPIHNSKMSSKKKDGNSHGFYAGGDCGGATPNVETYFVKRKQKDKTNKSSYLLEHNGLETAQMSERLKTGSKNHSSEKKRKGTSYLDQILHLDGTSRLIDAQTQSSTSGDRVHTVDTYNLDTDVKLTPNMSTCNFVSTKRKIQPEEVYRDDTDDAAYQEASPGKQIDDIRQLKKKARRNVDAAVQSSDTPNHTLPDKKELDAEPETKIQKKPYTPVTPTVHTGFSFSIIHLLSAIRKALITACLEDKQNKGVEVVNGTDVNTLQHPRQDNLAPLTVQEIVNKVRSNPGDPCILETQEPLQDLIRGVLKIFSSRTAPLGAKGWKALVSYEKSTKSWFWLGPMPSNPSDIDAVEEDTSADAWGIPHKMLVKLVDSFANWLKSGQETLQQIGSLPPPPAMAPVLDEKERFRDLRAQKSLHTISPCSDEVRAYFRREEFLRYSIPDRAFSYTARDGKKSIVAPLRRGGGKPTSKARDHFMLKPDRPPHVTILCLVRDAAARLPGSIGTRADVCTLLRDSQYIVEDVTDAQVNQVVSGALDRLHYERDPCVQYDSDRKLWVYLHRDREEEDFEDDGTSSTKKWKRPKKDVADGTADDSAAGYDFNADLNVEAGGEKGELVYSDIRPNVDNIQTFTESAPRDQGNPVDWKVLEMNPLNENKMLYQESLR